MPDTDSYDSSAGNEQLSEASQKTKEAAQSQATANAQGSQDASDAAKAGGLFGKKPKPATAPAASAPSDKGLIGAIKGSFKTGGTVPETGNYKLHAGEEVLPKGRASEYRKVFKQRGQSGKHKYGA